jgi:hypothetical protein
MLRDSRGGTPMDTGAFLPITDAASYLGITKKVIARIPAVSGQPGTTPNDAGKPNSGPIPPGEYSIDPDKIGRNRTFNWPGPDFSESNDAWGNYRVPLDPKPGTNTLGRGGFFIHGGTNMGSIGCIDVGPNDQYVMDLTRKWGHGKPMTVIVDYGYGPHLPVPGTLRAPVTWRGGSMRQ